MQVILDHWIHHAVFSPPRTIPSSKILYKQIDLITDFDSILTGRQSGQK